MSPLLPGYPVAIDISVAWGEMDAFGHVNNVAYFERADALADMERAGCGPILAETRCRYRLPLSYPDRLTAGARISAVAEDRFTMQYAVASAKAGRIAAEGEAVVVWYDYRARSKTALPPALRARIEALEATR
jgi:acyl-CoA thioester hydrolase